VLKLVKDVTLTTNYNTIIVRRNTRD